MSCGVDRDRLAVNDVRRRLPAANNRLVLHVIDDEGADVHPELRDRQPLGRTAAEIPLHDVVQQASAGRSAPTDLPPRSVISRTGAISERASCFTSTPSM